MRNVLLVSLGVFVSACGGSGSSPASPTPSQPTVLAITIVGPAVVPTGSSETYSVTAILSNGAKVNNATPTTWSIDNASVATIDDNGVLTVRGRGTATITATHQGRNATATVRVPVDNDNPGGANLVISFRPDPVPGSLAPCTGAFWAGQTPSWSMDEVFNETQGVGFTVKLEILNLYNQDGALIYHFSFPEDYYFPPSSEFVEDGCATLGGAPSGFLEEIEDGVDDRGNRLTFASRVRLLPVAGVSPASSRISPAPMAPGAVVRTRRRAQ